MTLILANIAYFAWQHVPREKPPQSAKVKVDPDEHRNDITLLKEAGHTSSRALKQLVDTPIINVVNNTDQDQCFALGPFASVYESQAMSSQLQAMGSEVEARAVDEATGEFDYRLMIEPLNSLEESFRRLRELQANKIDSYVITTGENALGISLGVFSTREAAENARNKVASDGFDSKISEIKRFSRAYWLFGEQGIMANLDDSVWKNSQNGNQSIKKRNLPCE